MFVKVQNEYNLYDQYNINLLRRYIYIYLNLFLKKAKLLHEDIKELWLIQLQVSNYIQHLLVTSQLPHTHRII